MGDTAVIVPAVSEAAKAAAACRVGEIIQWHLWPLWKL